MSKLSKCLQCGKLAYAGETVTIPVSEFEALTQSAAEASVRKKVSKYRLISRSAIARNPAQADFIIESLATMTIAEVHAAVVKKYGPKAPSRSAIYRFAEAAKKFGT